MKDLSIERSISCQRQLQPAHSLGPEPCEENHVEHNEWCCVVLGVKLRNCENITTWRWRRRGRSVLGRFPAEPEQRSSRPGQDFVLSFVYLTKKDHVILILSWKSLRDPEGQVSHLMLVPSRQGLKHTRSVGRSNGLVLADHQQLRSCCC